MKPITKILIAVLIISGLMPMMACILAAINQPKIMEMFHLNSSSSPDQEKAIVILGAAMISGAIIQFIAAGWIWKGKAEGYALSLWVSLILISASLYMLIFFNVHNIHDPRMFAIDLVKGILILSLTLYSRRKFIISG